MTLDFNEALGNEGAGYAVDSLGKEYRLFPLTAKVKAEFAAWVQKLAREAAFSEPSSTRDQSIDRYLLQKRKGEFNWGRKNVAEMMTCDEGIYYLYYLLMTKGNPDKNLKQREVDLLEVKSAVDSEEIKFAFALREILKNAEGEAGIQEMKS